jgi:hypothetical protein
MDRETKAKGIIMEDETTKSANAAEEAKPAGTERSEYANSYLDTEVYDTATRILDIDDELSKGIILDNIDDVIEEPFARQNRMNYVDNFIQRFDRISEGADDTDLAALKDSADEICGAVNAGLRKKYAVCTGDDLNVVSPRDALEHLRTLYEFFFVRNYQNLLDYFRSELERREDDFIERYKEISQGAEYADDLFMQQDRKRFSNPDLAILFHFMPEMVDDIRSNISSGTELFRQIAGLDAYEETNAAILGMLDDYGTGIAVVDDDDAADLYLAVLRDPSAFSDFKNDLRMCILDDLTVAGQ